MSADFSDILRPFGAAFRLGVAAKNSLYDRGWLQAEGVGRPMVSIGNLTTGGTGKTPFVDWLARDFVARGRRPAVISRGYRGVLEGEGGEIDFTSGKRLAQLARLYGDEPVMLAHRLREVPVFIGRDKIETGRRAVQKCRPDIVLADDAFQHRRLKRDFDIVLLDATEPGWHFRPLPVGRMREPFRALGRAHAVVITKVNLADPGRVERLHDLARLAVDSTHLPAFTEMEYRLKKFSPLDAFHAANARGAGTSPATEIDARALARERLILFSGIGRPQGFRRLVEIETGARVMDTLDFADHHPFGPEDLARVLSLVKATKATGVVCTEKDAVKLDSGLPWDCPTWVSRLDAIPSGRWDGFHSMIEQTLFERGHQRGGG